MSSEHSLEGKFPRRVDINPTAICNLHCPWCYGPEPSLGAPLTTDQWLGAMNYLVRNGTQEFTFNGGEPLMRKDIDILLKHAKELGTRVTLSTNGILIPKHIEAIRNYVDDIGIPIDGSTSEINSRSRVGIKNHFDIALSMIGYVREVKPEIDITVRTVVSKLNYFDIENIGKVIEDKSIDRWKVAQMFLPNWDQIEYWDRLKVSHEFDNATEDLRQKFPKLNIDIQSIAQQLKGYVFVWPNADTISIYGNGPNIVNDQSENTREQLSLMGRFQK